MSYWTEEQIKILKQEYMKDSPNLYELSEKLGRLRSNICRKARELGLGTSCKRPKRLESIEKGKSTKGLLQELLNETQNEMSTYRQLSRKKKKKKKLMEAYRYLMYRELSLKEAIGECEKYPLKTTARYVGGEPKMEVCELEKA